MVLFRVHADWLAAEEKQNDFCRHIVTNKVYTLRNGQCLTCVHPIRDARG